jgi:hypothetical protein
MDPTLVMTLALMVVTTLLAGTVFLHHREREKLLERERRLAERLWEVEDQFRYHLATMRRAGYETQPVDEAWETHTISDEAEAEIEAERERMGLLRSDN